MPLPEYELFAIRYATREARRADHFVAGDPHDGPMPMDYFVWVAKGPERVEVRVSVGAETATVIWRVRRLLCSIAWINARPAWPLPSVKGWIVKRGHSLCCKLFHAEGRRPMRSRRPR